MVNNKSPFQSVIEDYGWKILSGPEQGMGSKADIYAENVVNNFCFLIDDGTVNTYGEVIHIYAVNDDGSHFQCKIFEGRFETDYEFRMLMKLLGIKRLTRLEKEITVGSDLEYEVIQNLIADIEYPFIPKGWVSISDHLPEVRIEDAVQGYSEFLVKDETGDMFTKVYDTDEFLYYAKEVGITHWFNPK